MYLCLIHQAVALMVAALIAVADIAVIPVVITQVVPRLTEFNQHIFQGLADLDIIDTAPPAMYIQTSI